MSHSGEQSDRSPQPLPAELFDWSPAATPGSPERADLTRQLERLGWDAILEALPPGPANAYRSLIDQGQAATNGLAGSSTTTEDNWNQTLRDYLNFRRDITAYELEHGTWFGLPPAGRAAVNNSLRELDETDPFQYEERERLLERLHETEDRATDDFISAVAEDQLMSLGPRALATAPFDGQEVLNRWWHYRTTTDIGYHGDQQPGPAILKSTIETITALLRRALHG